MRGLNRKLRRDVVTLRWQIASIALVVASGVAQLVASYGTYRSLENARARFYSATGFADVFVSLTRAPDAIENELAEIDGVAGVETRLSFEVPLDVPSEAEPVLARAISLPVEARPLRARLLVQRGRLPSPDAQDEVAVSEAFAEARGLRIGEELIAVLHGRREALTIVGLVLSPEHIAALRPGTILPDDEHYGVIWLAHETLATAYQAHGTFDEAVLWLAPGASEARVIGAVDRVLAPYGSRGAITRRDQPAHRFVDGELVELEVEATVLPVIFLGVASFLLYIVLARLVTQERTQIATLRALGVRVGPIVRHYVALATFIAAIGAAVGVLGGVAMGHGLVEIYRDFFRFPDFHFELEPRLVAIATGTSLLAALLGAIGPARHIARMAPAEAMQPPTPHAFHTTWLERIGIAARLSPSMRLVLRDVASRPARTALAVAGIASAMGILVVGAFWYDAFAALLVHQFERVQHEDAIVGLVSTMPDRAARELAHVPGVRLAEGVRTVPVRMSFERRSRRVELMGLAPGSRLRRLVDLAGHEVALPADGLVLSRHLAERLGARAGSRVALDVLEGERVHREVPVAIVVDEMLGLSAYLRSDALAGLLDETPSVSGALLSIEPGREVDVQRALRRFPGVATVTMTHALVHRFQSTMMEIVLVASAVLTLLGALVVMGVVYNAARILVSEREREFATLRVLGFTRADVSESLLIELAVQIVPALGLGALLGYALSAMASRLFGPEDLSIPLVVGPRTWGLALGVVLVSTLGSALAVRRRLDRLDLVGVLKVRE